MEHNPEDERTSEVAKTWLRIVAAAIAEILAPKLAPRVDAREARFLVGLKDHLDLRPICKECDWNDGDGAVRAQQYRHHVLAVEKVEGRMSALGIEGIPCVGKADFQLHEPVEVLPTQVEEEDAEIVDVILPGYRVNGQVLRSAKVAVRKFEPAMAHEQAKGE